MQGKYLELKLDVLHI